MAGTRVLGMTAVNGIDSYSSPSCERIVRSRCGQETGEQYLELWFEYWLHICIHIDVDVNVHAIVFRHRGAKVLRHCLQVGSHLVQGRGEEWAEEEMIPEGGSI
jgi:hypothetical protein